VFFLSDDIKGTRLAEKAFSCYMVEGFLEDSLQKWSGNYALCEEDTKDNEFHKFFLPLFRSCARSYVLFG